MPHRQSWNTRNPEARSFCQSCRVGAGPRHLSHRQLPSQTHLQGPDWKWSKQVSTGIGVNPPVSQHQPGFFFFLNLKVKRYRKWEVNDKQAERSSVGLSSAEPLSPIQVDFTGANWKSWRFSVCLKFKYYLSHVVCFLWKYLLAGAFFFLIMGCCGVLFFQKLHHRYTACIL